MPGKIERGPLGGQRRSRDEAKGRKRVTEQKEKERTLLESRHSARLGFDLASLPRKCASEAARARAGGELNSPERAKNTSMKMCQYQATVHSFHLLEYNPKNQDIIFHLPK
jgi:hypothetical protein